MNQITRIKELLGRTSPCPAEELPTSTFANRRVLITGGGGSIGQELCRKVAECHPAELIILDIYENNAYEIEQELTRKYGSSLSLSGWSGSCLPASVSSVSWPACSRSSEPSPWLRGTVSSMPGHPRPPLTTPSAPNIPPLIPAYPSSLSLPRGLPAYSACSQHALNVPRMPLCTHFSRHSFCWHEPFVLHPQFSERDLVLALVWPARGRCCLPNRGRMHPQGMAAAD